MLEMLTGSGLALSAGLNAFIPLLMMGVLARFTDVLVLPEQWEWLSNEWVLVVFAVLLLLDVIADKVPAVDHLNDVVQTLVRPTAGGIVFAAGSGSETPAITDPAEFFTSAAVWPFIIGLVLALTTHLAKASGRAVVNLSTAGIGAPVVSTVEDVSSLTLTVLAILVPLLVVVFLLAMVALALWARSIRARRRQARWTG
jgi:peptidoglycan/LPS O-acetylase OafA/YrhL